MALGEQADFFVSARRYRPTLFEDVVGQEHVTRTLQNALKRGQLSQALLFCGPHGVGKTTCARILACLINDFSDQDPTRPLNDLYTFELDAASYNSVDNIRNLVEQVRFPPPEGKRKVYIIDEVHMLSTQAFNAFLKTLEEPPAYVVFILATTEKQKVLPTILSRCQVFDFRRIDTAEIVSKLQEIAEKNGKEVSEEALYVIARKADGSLRDALSMYDMLCAFSPQRALGQQEVARVLHLLEQDVYFAMSAALCSGELAQALSLLGDIVKRGAHLLSFVVDMQIHLRDLLLAKREEGFRLLEASKERGEKYRKESAQYPDHFLNRALLTLARCEQGYKISKSPRLWVEVNLVAIAQEGEKSPPARDSSAEKKKQTNPVRPPVPSEDARAQPQGALSSEGVLAFLERYREELVRAGNVEHYALEGLSCTVKDRTVQLFADGVLRAGKLERKQTQLQERISRHFGYDVRLRVSARADERAPAAEEPHETEEEAYTRLVRAHPAIRVLQERLGLERAQ